MLKRLRCSVSALFRRRRFEEAMDEELRFHLETHERDLLSRGVPPAEARRRARMELGGADRTKEGCRESAGLRWIDELRQDVDQGLRSMRNTPGFTFVAVASLAIGIGANAAVFSIVNGVLLKPFPYRDPQQLVLLFEQIPVAASKFGFSPPDIEFFQKASRSYAGLAAYSNVEYELSGTVAPQRLMGARVSPELFSVLGVAPIIGRALTEDDDRQGARVAVLSHGLWSSAFGRDSAIVGRGISLDGRSYTVVGVMPPATEFPPRGGALNGEPAEVLVPMSFSPRDRQAFGRNYNHTLVARLARGVSIEQARSEAATLLPSLAERYPAILRDFASKQSIHIIPLSNEVVGNSGRLLSVLMAAVVLVLLMVCANVANLMLTHASARERELAVRAALGASRVRLARQLLTEAFVLAIVSGALGLLVANGAMRAMVSFAANTLPRADTIAFDYRAVAFTCAVALASPLLFGMLPALRAAGRFDAEALRESGRSMTPGRRRSRLLGVLVVTQFALALVLTVGAGLLVRSFARLLTTDPGFRSEETVRVTAVLPGGRYAPPQVLGFYRQAIDAARTVPGDPLVGAGSDMPMGVRERRAFSVNGSAAAIPEQARLIAATWITGRYFEALGIPLRQGRFITDADGPDSQPAIVINDVLARTLWPGGDAVGRQIKWGIDASEAPWMTIVGVVGDVKQSTLDTPVMFQVYVPVIQDLSGGNLLRTVNLIVRSDRDAGSLIADLRAAMHRLDPALPIAKAQPLAEIIDESVQPQRFSMLVVTLFAAVALGLAATGIYGVLADVVRQRAPELGIRMALGASRSSVMQMVLGRAFGLMAIGVTAGVAASLAATRIMTGVLYDVRPTDTATFVAAAVVLAVVALLASLIPAWRATRVDSLMVLRTE